MSFLSQLHARFKNGIGTDRKRQPARSNAWRPMLEGLEVRDVPSTVTSITSNFNGTPIAANSTLWFSSVFKPSGVGSNSVTLNVTDQTITFSANGTPVTVNVPDSVIHLSPGTTAASATTTFDAGQNTWVSNLPSSFSGNGFLSGAAYTTATGLPGGIKPVTWTANVSSDTPGVSLNWQWAAAVYTSFGSDPGVKPLDMKTSLYNNSHHAGTPENFTSHLVGGARGGGGSNFTGSYSATAKVYPGVAPPPPSGSLSGYVYFDVNGDRLRSEFDVPLANIVITLTDSNGNVVAEAITDDHGYYSFTSLAAGTYNITESQPDGFYQGENNIGSLGGTVDYDTFTLVLGPGDMGVEYNFGETLSNPNS